MGQSPGVKLFLPNKQKMTIKEALKKYRAIEIELLLSQVLGKPKEFLYMAPEHRLSSHQVKSLSSLVMRREKGEPVAYLLGYKDFYGLRFKVNKHVLIPRPETEGLVERVVQSLLLFKEEYSRLGGREVVGVVSDDDSNPSVPAKAGPPSLKKGRMLRVLDLGTGSGCIAISLAKSLSKISVDITASDISKKALSIAKFNARKHKVKVRFYRSDLLANVPGKFDLIVANLPYGWQAWKNNTSAATIGLKHEPKQALFTKENGLMQIKRLLIQLVKRKQKPKLIYLEFDPRQKLALFKLIKKHLPKADVKFSKDFNSLWRYAEIKIKN